MERLQKILSRAGVASRRASEQLMLDGRVTVNGHTVRELGTKADPAQDDIRVDGRRIKLSERHRYLLLNKPRGYVTTRSDPEKRPTVMDLIGGVTDYVYPVGRLDYESEGLLLLTNDGDLAARLTHPSHGVARVYEARVLGIPDRHDVERLKKGVTLEGRRTEPAMIQLLPGRQEGHAALRVTIREGRNRQVRNMFEAIGHPVDQLTRIAIGPLRDSRLKVGHWRNLTPAEVEALQKAAMHEGRDRQDQRHGVDRHRLKADVQRQDGREGNIPRAQRPVGRDTGVKDPPKPRGPKRDARPSARDQRRPSNRSDQKTSARREQPVWKDRTSSADTKQSPRPSRPEPTRGGKPPGRRR